ncbi:transporter substrate-binding domain-containing protein [Aneurinibacillus soli]|nr:transporter substrate-binding domain-containing protein [Aneurinibacillus soli]
MYIRFICLCFFLLFLSIVPLSAASAEPTPASLAPKTFKIAADNHVTFQYVPMNLNEAERELRAGHIDAIAGLSYSTEKSKRFDFSDSYFTMSDALIVPIAQKNAIQTAEELHYPRRRH